MSDIRARLIKPDTELRLKKHGLDIKLKKDDWRSEPFTRGYFKFVTRPEWHDAPQNEIWRPVYVENTNNQTLYSKMPFPTLDNGGFAGFLVANKETLLHDHEQGWTLKSMNFWNEAEVDIWADAEVAEIISKQNIYCNHDAYAVSVIADKVAAEADWSVDDVGDAIDTAVNQSISRILETLIETDSLVRLCVDINPKVLHKGVSPSQYLLNSLNERFMARFAVNDSNYPSEDCRLVMEVCLDSLPRFGKIQLNGEPLSIESFMTRLLEVIKENDYERMSVDDYAGAVYMLQYKLGFAHWPHEMAETLFRIALDGLDGINIIKIDMRNAIPKDSQYYCHENRFTPTFMRHATGVEFKLPAAPKEQVTEDENHQFVKFKTKARMRAHGLALVIEPDTSTDDPNTYITDVKMQENWLDGMIYGCKNENGAIDEQVSKSIDGVIEGINRDNQTLLVKIKVDAKIHKTSSPTELLLKNIKNEYGVVPALGDINFNKKAGELSIRLSLRSLPMFICLLDTSENNVHMQLKKKVIALSEGKVFRAVDEGEVLNALIDNKPYKQWHTIMLHGLLEMFVDTTEGMTLERIYN